MAEIGSRVVVDGYPRIAHSVSYVICFTLYLSIQRVDEPSGSSMQITMALAGELVLRRAASGISDGLHVSLACRTPSRIHVAAGLHATLCAPFSASPISI